MNFDTSKTFGAKDALQGKCVKSFFKYEAGTWKEWDENSGKPKTYFFNEKDGTWKEWNEDSGEPKTYLFSEEAPCDNLLEITDNVYMNFTVQYYWPDDKTCQLKVWLQPYYYKKDEEKYVNYTPKTEEKFNSFYGSYERPKYFKVHEQHSTLKICGKSYNIGNQLLAITDPIWQGTISEIDTTIKNLEITFNFDKYFTIRTAELNETQLSAISSDTNESINLGNNSGTAVHLFIDISGKNTVKIPKSSKYEKNVIFNQAGINELLTNIKNYPIVSIEEVASDTKDQESDENSIWQTYTGGKPCLKITYGNKDKEFNYTSGFTTKGYQYVPVGSNIKFYDGEEEIESTTGDQQTGTIKVQINGETYYAPVKGLSGSGSSGAINFDGDILPSQNDTHNIGSSVLYWKNGYFTNLTATNLTANNLKITKGDTTTTLNLTNGEKYQFLRGDLSWNNELFRSDDAAELKLNTNKDSSRQGKIYLGSVVKNNIGTAAITIDGAVDNSGTNTAATRLMLSAASPSLTDSYLTTLYIKMAANKDNSATDGSFDSYRSQIYCSNDTVFKAAKVFNAVFNDYAEYRTTIDLPAGYIVIDNDDGTLARTTARLQPGAQAISDTFGHSMGETPTAKTPLAVAGRVLVYTFQPRKNYHAGMAVCSAPDGTVDIMTREEIRNYPDCIVGIVSEIPEYETWGTDNIKVNGRIWIKVK